MIVASALLAGCNALLSEGSAEWANAGNCGAGFPASIAYDSALRRNGDRNWSGGNPASPIVPAPRHAAQTDVLSTIYKSGIITDGKQLANREGRL